MVLIPKGSFWIVALLHSVRWIYIYIYHTIYKDELSETKLHVSLGLPERQQCTTRMRSGFNIFVYLKFAMFECSKFRNVNSAIIPQSSVMKMLGSMTQNYVKIT